MRIISGKYRRRTLMANPGLTTRPISDFVKESLFTRLEDHLPGQRIADIFSGTGTIGLEALSRGAASVVFIEKDPKAVELLKRNIATLKAEADCLCWQTDIFRCSFRPKGDSEKFVPFDWVFFDPPFVMVEELNPKSELFRVLKQLAREGITAPDARLVLRTPQHVEFTMPPQWQQEHHWPFSRMQVFVYRKTPTISEVETSTGDSESLPSEDQAAVVAPENPT